MGKKRKAGRAKTSTAQTTVECVEHSEKSLTASRADSAYVEESESNAAKHRTLQAIVELHAPALAFFGDGTPLVCGECGQVSDRFSDVGYPCPTVEAIVDTDRPELLSRNQYTREIVQLLAGE